MTKVFFCRINWIHLTAWTVGSAFLAWLGLQGMPWEDVLLICLVGLLMCGILLPNRKEVQLQEIREGEGVIGGHKLSFRLQLIGSFIGATGGGPPTCKIHCSLEFSSPPPVPFEIVADSRNLRRIFCRRFCCTVIRGQTHPRIVLIMNQLAMMAKGRGLCGKAGCFRITEHGIVYTEGPYVYHPPMRGRVAEFQEELLQLANSICSS